MKLGKVESSGVSKALSNIFTIAFASGSGGNLVPIKNFNEKIDIVLPIDGYKMIKTNKVSIIDLTTTKLLRRNTTKESLNSRHPMEGNCRRKRLTIY